jgi:hypothetical protein
LQSEITHARYNIHYAVYTWHVDHIT